MHPSGPIRERKDIEVARYSRNGEIKPVEKQGKHLGIGIEPQDINDKGKPVPKWKLYYAKGMIGWAVLSHTFLLIQAIEIYTNENASGVSLAAYIVYLVGAVIWGVYGAFVLTRRNIVIVVSSVTAFLLGTVVLIGIILYGNRPPDCGGGTIPDGET